MGTYKSGGIEMDIISFSLRGKMAHFRKFYSNSSVLSYFIPPRTTLIGIIAGILGYERDSYYEEFSLANCKITVASKMPIKKCMQKLNLLMVKSPRDLNGSAEHHSQTATELVIPQDIRKGFLDYQVYFYHNNQDIMVELFNKLTTYSHGYQSSGISVSLGTAYNLGWIDNSCMIEGEERKENQDKYIFSVIPIHKIKNIMLEGLKTTDYRLIKEEIPLEFNKERKITDNGLGNMLINLNGNPVLVNTDCYIELENGKTITWMD